MADSFPRPRYVLGGLDADLVKTMLGDIKSNLGKVELNFQAADLPAMSVALHALTGQIQELKTQVRTDDADDPVVVSAISGLMLVSPDRSLPALYSADLATRTAHYDSVEAFERVATELVRAKQVEDPRIQKALADLLQTCKPKRAPEHVLAEYYVQFFPAQEVLAAEPVGVLRRIFEALKVALAKLFTTFKAGAAVVWDVLKDPDDTYLRLRGEMHELRADHPDYKWLEYVVLLPDLFRLYVRLLFDPDVAWPVKAKVLGALAYLVCPLDLLPEALLGPIGYTEDVFLMAKAILDMTNSHQVAPGKLRQHWAGDVAVLGQLMWVSQEFEEHFDFFRMLYDWFRSRPRPQPAAGG